MPTVNLMPIANDAPYFLPTGVAASGYKIFTYAAGTTTKTNTYTDSTGNTANANPIILNSSGYPAASGNVVGVWGIAGTSYKLVFAPSTDTDPPVASIWTRDNIALINDLTVTQAEWLTGPTPTYISATSFTLVGDQTGTWTIGRRIKATVTAGTVYGRITASAYTTLTTLTVQMDGTQALDSGLSAVSYALLASLVKSEPERIGTSSGTDTYTATVGITRLVIGDEYKITFTNSNLTTTPTLNLDSTGAKTIIRADGTAVQPGDVVGNRTVLWNGTSMVLLNPEPFTTGDVKLTFKTTADGGWVLMNDGTIGNAASAGTTRANADTVALFTLLWNNTANADCAVSTGRGANAAADYAANKTIALPKALGRALATYGTGAGLTARTLAHVVGSETLITGELPAHAHGAGTYTWPATDGAGAGSATRYGVVTPSASTGGGATNTDVPVSGSSGSTGSGTADSKMQPTVFLNTMIKL